jgi:hypothetical protein
MTVTARMCRPSLSAMGRSSQCVGVWGLGPGAWEDRASSVARCPLSVARFSPLPFLRLLSSFAEEESVLPGVRFGEAPFPGEGGAEPFWFGVRFLPWSCGPEAGLPPVGRVDLFPSAIACCHTAPIGNLGMRTQATRQFECTGNLHGVLRAAFFDYDRQV